MQGRSRSERTAGLTETRQPSPTPVQSGGQVLKPVCPQDPPQTGDQSRLPLEEALPHPHACPCPDTRQTLAALGDGEKTCLPNPAPTGGNPSCAESQRGWGGYEAGLLPWGMAGNQQSSPTTGRSRMQPPRERVRELYTLHQVGPKIICHRGGSWMEA